MNRGIRLAMRLYPAEWRARYGAEFEALLEDMHAGWRNVGNVALGALKMQLTTWSLWKLAPVLAIAGALAAGAASYAIADRWESYAVVRIAGPDTDRVAVVESVQNAQSKALARAALAKVITEERLYPRTLESATLEDAVQQMMADTAIRVMDLRGRQTGLVLQVRFGYPDRVKAQRVTSRLTAALSEAYAAEASHGERVGAFEVLDAPSLPASPASPNRRSMVLAGLFAGLLLGLALAALRRWPRAFAGALVGGVLGGLVAWGCCTGYEYSRGAYFSGAVLRARGADPSEALRSVQSDDSLSAIARRNDLYPGQTPAESAARMRRGLAIRKLGSPGILHDPSQAAYQILFRHSDKYKAQLAVRDVMAALMQANPMEVLDKPYLASRPQGPSDGAILLGAACGLLLGVIAARRLRLPPSAPTQVPLQAS